MAFIWKNKEYQDENKEEETLKKKTEEDELGGEGGGGRLTTNPDPEDNGSLNKEEEGNKEEVKPDAEGKPAEPNAEDKTPITVEQINAMFKDKTHLQIQELARDNGFPPSEWGSLNKQKLKEYLTTALMKA